MLFCVVVVVVVFFNTRLGTQSRAEMKVGPHGIGRQNHRGHLLANFLEKEDLFTMNSFFERSHKKRKWTWISPDGSTKSEINVILADKRYIFNDVSVISRFKAGSDHRLVRGSLIIDLKLERSRLMKSTLELIQIHYRSLAEEGLGWWHHPHEENTTNFPGLYIYYTLFTEGVLVFGFVSLESIDPFIGEKDLDRFMFSISFVITHDLTIIKMYILFFKNREIQDVVHTLEIGLQAYYQNNFKNRRMIKITRIMTASFVFFGWVTIANINVYGIYQDLKWKTEIANLNDTIQKPFRALPQPVYVPWSYQTDKSFVLTFLMESVGVFWTAHIVLTIDTFIASVILHMSSQFEILQEAFITAYDRTMTKLSERFQQEYPNDNVFPNSSHSEEVNYYDYNESIVRRYYTHEEIESALGNTLKNCFQQHQVLVSCVEKFGKTYTYGFMTQLISSSAAICVVMLQLSKDASGLMSISLVTSLAFFCVMVIQLAIQCFSGNALTDQASKVSEAIMQSKWERMSPRLRKQLALAMMRAQRPLQLTAGGFATLNNDCFFAIMKAAYSYYAVLSQKQV